MKLRDSVQGKKINKYFHSVWALLAAFLILSSPAMAFATNSGILINEFQANPITLNVGDKGEWVEMANTTDVDVVVSGWKLHDSIGLRFTFPSPATIPANDYAVICADISIAGANCDYQWTGGDILNNSGDTLTLKDDSGADIDTVIYQAADAKKGNSTEVVHDATGAVSELVESTVTPYGGAGNTGTPGAVNAAVITAATPADTVVNTRTGTTYPTIQAAIDAAIDGDQLNIGPGTYTEAPNITKNLTLNGQGQGVVTIAPGASTGYGIEATGKDVTIQNLTLTGASTYGIKISGGTVTVNNVTVIGSGKTNIDFNGVTTGRILNSKVQNAVSGNGISLTDSSNITVDNVHSSGNPWGGIAVYTDGGYPNSVSADDYTLTNISASEPNPLYWQVGNLLPITNFNAPDFTHTVENDASAANFTFWRPNEANALAAASLANIAGPTRSVVREVSSGNFIVNPALSIETAFELAPAGQFVVAIPGVYPEVKLMGTYSDNLTLRSQQGVATVVFPSIVLDSSTFNGLTFDSLTFKGVASVYGLSSVTVGAAGTYANLTVQNSVFDGENSARRAIFMNQGFDGFALLNNEFKNYDGYNPNFSQTLYSVVFAEAQSSSPMGNNYTATGNSLINSTQENFLEAYRWQNVNFSSNIINSIRGRLLVWSDDAGAVGSVNITNNKITLTTHTGIGTYYMPGTNVNIADNIISGAQSCIKVYGVSGLSVTDNDIGACSVEGLVVGDSANVIIATDTPVVDNVFSSSPLGINNASVASLSACSNTFTSVTIEKTGLFTPCDTTVPEMSNLKMFVQDSGGTYNPATFVKKGDMVRVEVDATDAGSGIKDVVFRIKDANGGGYIFSQTWIDTPVSGDTYRFDFQIPTDGKYINLHTPINELIDGNSAWARATDNAGNYNEAGLTQLFTYDNTNPSEPTITKPGARTWHKTSPILGEWTAVSDPSGIDHYQIAYNYDDGHSFGGSTCPGVSIPDVTGFIGCRDVNGTQRNHTPGVNEEGGVTIWVRAIDGVGNVGSWSASMHYYYDHTAPATTINVPTGITDGTFTVNGHASDNLQLNRVYVQLVNRDNNQRYGGTTINLIPDGVNADWSRDYNASASADDLPDGTYAASVSVTDMAGNTSKSGWTTNFIVDNTAPTVTILDPLSGDVRAGTFTGSATVTDENVLTDVRLRFNNPVTNAIVQTYTMTNVSGDTWGYSVDSIADLPDGDYRMRVIATDEVGNKKNVNEVPITIDNTKPTITLDLPIDGSTVAGTVDLEATCDEECDYINFWWRAEGGSYSNTSPEKNYHYVYTNGTTFTWSLDSLNAERWTPDSPYPMDDGTYYFYAAGKDVVGNWAKTTETSITIDNTAPSITVTAPSEGTYNSGVITIAGTATDAGSGIDKVAMHIFNANPDGTRGSLVAGCNPVNATLGASDTWTAEINNGGSCVLLDGYYVINSWAIDNAGNTDWAPDSRFYADNTAPTVNAGTDKTNQSATFTQVGSADDGTGSGVALTEWSEVSGPGTVFVDDKNAQTTRFRADVDGIYTVMLSAIDNVGNVSSDTFTFTWTNPVEPPVTPPDPDNPLPDDGGGIGGNPPAGGGTFNPADQGDGSVTNVDGITTDGEDDGTGTTEVIAATDNSKSTDGDGCFKILSVCWYWWLLLIPAAVIAYIIYRYFNEDEDDDEDA